MHGNSASDRAFAGRVKIAPQCYADLAAYRDVAKAVTFVNCWHINNDEDPRMWQAYTTTNDSVLLISSAGRLKASLQHPVAMSAVKYVDESTPRTEFGERSLFFYKDTEFAFEREYRLLIDLFDIGGEIRHDHPDDFFRRVSVDITTLVYAVQPHPKSTDKTQQKIASLLSDVLPCMRPVSEIATIKD